MPPTKEGDYAIEGGGTQNLVSDRAKWEKAESFVSKAEKRD